MFHKNLRPKVDHYQKGCISATVNIRNIIMWTTPSAVEMRFGFEVTMYVMNK